MSMNRRKFLQTGASLGVLAFVPARLSAEQSAYAIPIRLTDRRLLVDCLIDGHGPWPFVIDTGGAVGLLDDVVADRLGLRSVGKSRLAIHGVWRRYEMMLVERLSFGGLIDQQSAVFAATDNVGFGDGAVGSLAAGAITAIESEFDFVAGEWRLYPQGGPPRTDWTRIDRAFVREGNKQGSSWIFAPIEIGGKEYPIGLDTGAPTELRLSGDAMKQSGLWDSPRWAPGSPNGEGRVVRIPELKIGGTVLKGVIANLYPKSQWDYFDNGLVGLPILRRFDIATKPKEDALFLRRNGNPDPAPYYNRAGMWLDADGTDLKVVSVGPGSPAALAGIEAGDRVLDADFTSTINAIHRPAGTVLKLQVRTKTGVRDIDLVLADYL